MASDDLPTAQRGPSRRSVLGASAASAGVLLGLAGPAFAAGGSGAPTSSRAAASPGLAPFPQQEDLNFETLFAYGEAAYGAGEIGEIAATVGLIQADIAAAGSKALPAYDAYVRRFEELGRRLGQQADEERKAGRLISARSKYLRSASYYNCALFFILGTSTPGRETAIYSAMQAKWASAAALLSPAFERVEIPARVRYPSPSGRGAPVVRSLRIPAYFAAAPGPGRKPTVIVNNGSDAQFVDVYAFGAAAALERGYNALIFEGPGQGSMLFEQDVPFTPYWQDVVTPLVDYLIARPDVDASKLGLTGWSFGGLLVFRAAAFEHRIKGVVGDPGFVDNSRPWSELTDALKAFGGVSNAAFPKVIDALPRYGVPKGQLALRFTIGKRGEIYGREYRAAALAGKLNPDIVGLLQRVSSFNADDELLSTVRAHVLIDNYEGDQFFPPSQSNALKAGLTGAASVTQHRFTAAEGAEYHCAPMAPQLRNEVVYDWFDQIFSGAAAPAGVARSSHSNLVGLGIVAGAGVVLGGGVTAAEMHRRRHTRGDEACRRDHHRRQRAPRRAAAPARRRRGGDAAGSRRLTGRYRRRSPVGGWRRRPSGKCSERGLRCGRRRAVRARAGRLHRHTE